MNFDRRSQLSLLILFAACDDAGSPMALGSSRLAATFDARAARMGDLRISLADWGRRGALVQAAPASPHLADGRVTIGRQGIVEWWTERPEGLEQGFTVDAPPSGDGELLLDLAIGGGSARIEGDSAALIPWNGPAIHYGSLAAWDADGHSLPTRLESRLGGLRLAVDDRGARSPITVDPLLSLAETLTSDQPAAQLGWSLAGAGDVNGDGYDDLVAGIPFFDPAQVDAGRVYLYPGGPTGVSPTPSRADGSQGSSLFGFSVASAGDVNGDGYADVVVGTEAWDNGQTDEGRASLYLGSPTSPLSGAAWTAESDQAGAAFGYCVSSAGDVNADGYGDVVVGSPDWDGTKVQEGRAWLFLGSSVGLGATPLWTFDGGQDFAQLGESLAAAGDVDGDGFDDVVVGAPGVTNGESAEGEALLFLGWGGGLQATPSWTAESDQANAFFGSAVSSAGDVDSDGYADLLIGAYSFSDGQTDEGQASVFRGSPAGPSVVADWTAESDQADASFGWAVAGLGDVNGDAYDDVAVGARFFDGGQANEGSVSVFLGSAAGVAASPLFVAQSDQAEAKLGYSVARAGDLDADGFADLVAGAYLYDDGQTDEGAAFVFLGACYDPVDADGDGVGDRCDACPGQDDTADADLDGAPDACDVCPGQDDALDADADAVPDGCDVCPADPDPGQADGDGDTVGDACDTDPSDPRQCADSDLDGCDDCSRGAIDPADDGVDTDGDGRCDVGDPDDDDDTVLDGSDLDPLDPLSCRDADNDQCDDCSAGPPPDPSADGLDSDHDGRCDAGDPDDDDDTVPDVSDTDPLDPTICRDADADTCDDCRTGTPDPANDGTDTDFDGKCDAGDPDDDDDGVADGIDTHPLDAAQCGDTDVDGCDDCTNGKSDPATDGPDTDADGICNAGDPDDDGDTVDDPDDANPEDPQSCQDVDLDHCDDCRTGLPDPANDGADTDADGVCDDSDTDDDGDGALDDDDILPLDPLFCGDLDGDGCDDCTTGTLDPGNDGPDADGDGQCDDSDTDDDGDTVNDTRDDDPLDPTVCEDVDGDGCDDCAGGTPDPSADGTDTDADGTCDLTDDDDDGDHVHDADDPDPLDPLVCGDDDGNGCDDCASDCTPPPPAEDQKQGCGCDDAARPSGTWAWLAAAWLAGRRARRSRGGG